MPGRLPRVGLGSVFASRLAGAAKPNSTIKGVDIGVITYSYRSMPDQSAEATLKYIVDSGISGTELMGGPVTDWARKKGKWDSSPGGLRQLQRRHPGLRDVVAQVAVAAVPLLLIHRLRE